MQFLIQKLNVVFNYFNHIKPTLSENNEKYNGGILRKDVIAGLTVAVVLIPNVLGYAILTGLPPVMGLYAALPAVVIAALWGSSRYVITAPVGVVSLLVVTSLSEHANVGSGEFITLAIALAVMVGIIQLLFGLFKLGILARLIPHSVIIGFTNAAAFLIIFSQIPSIVSNGGHGLSLTNVFSYNYLDVNLLSLLFGVVTVVLIILGKKLFPRMPVSMFVIVGSIFLTFLFPFEKYGMTLIGFIPSGIPDLSWSVITLPIVFTLLKQSFLIALVGFVETYSISKSLAKKREEKVDANKELNGQGLANIFSGVFGGFPVSGSFSASALNYSSGARSAVSGMVVSIVVLCALVFLGPFLSNIPKAVLAGVIIAAISQLINFKEIAHTFSLSRTDGILAVVTGVAAILFSPDDALFAGIFLAFAFFIHRSMNLKITEVGIHKEYGSLWSTESEDYSNLEVINEKIVLRVDFSILYANADLLEATVFEKISNHEEKFATKVKCLVLNCGGLNYLDLSGIEALLDLKKELLKQNVKLSFMLIKDSVWSEFEKSGLLEGVQYIHGVKDLAEYLRS